MNSRRIIASLWVVILAVPLTASAAPITYAITVNTSSIAGSSGSLDFNFNPGPLTTQAASLQILGFTSNGVLSESCPCSTGDVTGQLPGTLLFDNGSGYNDYFDGFTYGGSLTFDVSLNGPALSAPDGISTSGSAFAFSMFSNAAGTLPVLTTNTLEGFALTINTNLDGTTTLTNFSNQTTVGAASMATTPEPSGLSLTATGLLCATALFYRRSMQTIA
jgi:hypothetical protein